MDAFVPKSRPGTGGVMRGDRFPRYWQSKVTGAVVEIRRVLRDVDRDQMRIVFYDPSIGREMNMPYAKAELNPFQPPGAATPLMERPFKDLYEVYKDQRTTRV